VSVSSTTSNHSLTLPPISADPLSLIDSIHQRKMKAGVAISPDTPSTTITDQIALAADMLLVMTVYPGNNIFLVSS
jgi:pentose-5-phosphate-3-epimerase